MFSFHLTLHESQIECTPSILRQAVQWQLQEFTDAHPTSPYTAYWRELSIGQPEAHVFPDLHSDRVPNVRWFATRTPI